MLTYFVIVYMYIFVILVILVIVRLILLNRRNTYIDVLAKELH